jgi:hypothetical protein
MKNPRTSQERAVQYVFNFPWGQLITYSPAEFKIARENRYSKKICMILVSAVCRPAGHKKIQSSKGLYHENCELYRWIHRRERHEVVDARKFQYFMCTQRATMIFVQTNKQTRKGKYCDRMSLVG